MEDTSNNNNEWESLVNRLRYENTQHKSNLDQLKQAHSLLQDKYDALDSEFQLMAMQTEANEVDRNQMLNEWRQQLEEKTREFEAFRQRESLKPRDLESLRLQMFAEFETEASKRWQELTKQLDHWKGQSSNIQHDFDLFKASVMHKDSDFRSQLKEMEISHREELNRLIQKINEKNQVIDDSLQLADRLRQTQRESDEYQLKSKLLLQENDEIRAEKSESVSSYEQQIRVFRRQIGDLDAWSKQLQGEKDSYKSKLERTEEELRKTLQRLDSVLNESNQLRLENQKCTAQYEEAVHQFKVEANDYQLTLLKERSGWSQEKAELKKQCDKWRQEFEQIKQVNEEQSTQLIQMEKHNSENIMQAREEEWTKQRALEAEKKELESQLVKTQQTLHETRVNLDSLSKSAQTELENYRAEVKELQQKLQNSMARVEKMASENESLRTTCQEMQKSVADKDSALTCLQLELNDQKKQESTLRQRLNILDATHKQLQQEFMEHSDQSSKSQRTLESELERERNDRKVVESSGRRQLEIVQQELANAQEQLSSTQSVFKKLKSGYKKRLQDVQVTVDQLQQQLIKMDSDNKLLRQSLENENQNSQLRLREMYRKQDTFLQFLQKEGLAK